MSEAGQVVLEEIMYVAIDGAREALKAPQDDLFEQGRLMAYYDILDVIKEQAALLEVKFADQALADFDPDKEILNARRKQTAA